MSEDIYQIRLPIFEGPLDLLLHLIEKRQMEITAISLVAVADQFIEYLHTMPEPPIERIAEFVAMASRLLYIKSRSLLPRNTQPEDEESHAEAMADAEELRRNLLEYKLAREIAQMLRQREEAGLQSYARLTSPQGVEDVLAWAPPQLVGLNVDALTKAFKRALTESKERQPEELPLPIVTVAEKIDEIQNILKERSSFQLNELLTPQMRRIVIVVTFIAVLELWHQQHITVRQEELFGEVIVSKANT
jgi:segregation and condensation protein A